MYNSCLQNLFPAMLVLLFSNCQAKMLKEWCSSFCKGTLIYYTHIVVCVYTPSPGTNSEWPALDSKCCKYLFREKYYKLQWQLDNYPMLKHSGYQRFSKTRAAKRREEKRGEGRGENLSLSLTVDWSYSPNRFELGSRSYPASWLEEPYSILWLALVNWQVCCYWLLVNQFSWHLS